MAQVSVQYDILVNARNTDHVVQEIKKITDAYKEQQKAAGVTPGFSQSPSGLWLPSRTVGPNGDVFTRAFGSGTGMGSGQTPEDRMAIHVRQTAPSEDRTPSGTVSRGGSRGQGVFSLLKGGIKAVTSVDAGGSMAAPAGEAIEGIGGAGAAAAGVAGIIALAAMGVHKMVTTGVEYLNRYWTSGMAQRLGTNVLGGFQDFFRTSMSGGKTGLMGIPQSYFDSFVSAFSQFSTAAGGGGLGVLNDTMRQAVALGISPDIAGSLFGMRGMMGLLSSKGTNTNILRMARGAFGPAAANLYLQSLANTQQSVMGAGASMAGTSSAEFNREASLLAYMGPKLSGGAGMTAVGAMSTMSAATQNAIGMSGMNSPVSIVALLAFKRFIAKHPVNGVSATSSLPAIMAAMASNPGAVLQAEYEYTQTAIPNNALGGREFMLQKFNPNLTMAQIKGLETGLQGLETRGVYTGLDLKSYNKALAENKQPQEDIAATQQKWLNKIDTDLATLNANVVLYLKNLINAVLSHPTGVPNPSSDDTLPPYARNAPPLGSNNPSWRARM